MLDQSAPNDPAERDARARRWRHWHSVGTDYFAWQMRQFLPYLSERIADIGCGSGHIAKCLPPGTAYLGLDVSSALFPAATTLPEEPATCYALADANDPGILDLLREHRVSSIVCLGLLEHLRDDEAVAKNLSAALPPNGHLCLLLPAHRFLFGRLDEADGHFRRYSLSDARKLMAAADLKIEKLHYFNFLGGVAWWWRSRIMRRTALPNWSYSVIDRFIPVLALVESVVRPPFGISIIAVGRRRGDLP